MKKKKITIVHVGDFVAYPPVISLIENLLHNNINVDLVSSTEKERIPDKIRGNKNFNYIFISFTSKPGFKSRVKRLLTDKRKLREVVENSMKDSDILWTTTDVTVKVLGSLIFKYKHVMQLMELIQRYPSFLRVKALDFPIDVYAHKAYKVVVPDLDRAYIQQAWWNLQNLPVVLPNKPYSIPKIAKTDGMEQALECIKNEKRKIFLYTGVLAPERNIGDFAKALRNRPEYCVYIIGKSISGETYLEEFLKEHPNVVYLGYYNAPSHLQFLQYAYIGLTPYVPNKSPRYPALNALYCAPNKIYEYSAFGIPMIGTNVLGLLRPFEQYGIGKCAQDMTSSSILESINYVEEHYDEMRNNCLKFFEKDNLDQIVQDIIEE